MFGFIRPVKSEIKAEEVERFQSVYCGLCHTIKKEYGRLHTMFLSYDLTFLALILESLQEQDTDLEKKRCDASPIKNKTVLSQNEALTFAADISVLLCYHKIADSITDEKGLKKIFAYILRALCKRGYKKSSSRHKQLDEHFLIQLENLSQIERDKISSIDRPADTFAQMLEQCIPEQMMEQERVLKQLFYHTGRWIYLVDACEDIKEDFQSGSYNPIMLRYELEKPDISDIKEQLEITLSRSLASIYSAFSLLNINRDEPIISNIICLGMPMVTRQVLDGTYKPNGGKNKHGSI